MTTSFPMTFLPSSNLFKTMFSKLKTFALCVLTMTCHVEAQSPSLSVSLDLPDFLQFSWPSNFTSWQLVSTTNLASGIWQPVPLPPSPSSNALTVLLPISEVKRYFRLQQTGAGSCVFHATPPVINKGDSSTLTWCPVSGCTYRISPRPGPGGGAGGIVSGSSLVVSPTNTTVYTLTASNNVLGITSQDTTAIICNPCGWLQVSNVEAILGFRYPRIISTASYNFTILQAGFVKFNLQRLAGSTDTDAYFFGFPTADSSSSFLSNKALMNNREDDKTGPATFTTTEVGAGLPLVGVCYLSLHLTCTAYDFTYNVLIDTTETSQFGTTSSIDGAGTGAIGPRPITVGEYGEINNEAQIPAQYPPTSAEYFIPSSDLGERLFTTGTATPANAGTALVTWIFRPPP